MLKRLALAALVLSSFASGAVAEIQTTLQPQSRPAPSIGTYDLSNSQAKLWRQSMTADGQPAVTADQLRRARQAAALIKANHCEDAYKLALAEHDDRLALNIAVACKAQLRD